ncbi:MAG: hypothetical protein C0591_07045 [Marinilabiliales bacterium]|nr:MAG: hypothetical protein C0591_07045 [Marinilabiliales bacterium]
MIKDPWWKRELKEMFAIATVFFIIYILFLFMKKALLADYSIDFYIISAALVGSLILAKVVLIFDLLQLSRRMDHSPNIYRVFFRSFVYLLGFIIFKVLESMIKGLIDNESFSQALNSAIHELGETPFITSMVGVFVGFLFFNAFWVIRAKYGPKELYDLFFKKSV